MCFRFKLGNISIDFIFIYSPNFIDLWMGFLSFLICLILGLNNLFSHFRYIIFMFLLYILNVLFKQIYCIFLFLKLNSEFKFNRLQLGFLNVHIIFINYGLILNIFRVLFNFGSQYRTQILWIWSGMRLRWSWGWLMIFFIWSYWSSLIHHLVIWDYLFLMF